MNAREGGCETLKGMAFMGVSTMAVASVNAIGHHVSVEIHPFEIAFFRSMISIFVLAPAIVRRKFAPLRTRRPALLAARGLLDGASALFFFLALSLSPLAKVTALSFSAPLFATLLAVLFLGEVLRIRRISALLIGFAGTLVILRPGLVSLDSGSMSMLGFAALWGGAMVLTKGLSRTESSLTIALYSALVITPFALLAALPFWTTPSLTQLAWLVLIGFLSSLRQVTLAEAFRHADATAVLPLDFTKLIFAAVIGAVAFGEIPSAWTWAGGILIFVGGTAIAYGERR